MSLLRRYLPILTWRAAYSGRTFADELIVAGIVIIGLEPRQLLRAPQSTEIRAI
jgi:sulfate permease, SulP family